MSAIGPLGSHEPAPQALGRLLRLALTPAVQPADLLLEHGLAQRDAAWIADALDAASCEAQRPGPSLRDWPASAPDQALLTAVRAASKRRFESADATPARCASLFVYAWCIAASLVHRGTTGSSEPRDAVDGLLGAAATVAPPGLREFLDRAILVETE
jgi:hypothetical protein